MQNPYDYRGRPHAYRGSPTYGQPMTDTSSEGTTVFVFGILGFVLCQVFAPVAWVKGNEYVRTCAAMGVQPNGLGVAGRVLGIIGTLLFVLSLLFVVLVFLVQWANHSSF